MEVQAWVHNYTNDLSRSFWNHVVESLSESGVSVCQHGEDTAGPLGIILFDNINPGLLEVIGELTEGGHHRVMTVTASANLLREYEIWQLLQAGASDVLAWSNPASATQAVAARLHRWAAVERLVNSPLVQKNLVGKSRAWKGVVRRIVEIARFTDASVLILGESGTGKELAARLIHTLDARAEKRDLVVLDCSSLVPELTGSEFFGHERGSFTGALSRRDGAFALANGGSLFLDEIGELPLHLQPQLLRVVQERSYKPVGGNAWHRTEFRLICATNRDLMRSAEQGDFRADLYYRLANWICRLPPLRERRDDILPLAHHFAGELRRQESPAEFDEPVRRYLLERDYPGNVRELQQLIARMCCCHVGDGPITMGDIPEDDRPSAQADQKGWQDAQLEQAIRHALALGVSLKEISRVATEMAVRIAVEEEEGNLQRAAGRLGITDRALQLRRASRRQTLSS